LDASQHPIVGRRGSFSPLTRRRRRRRRPSFLPHAGRHPSSNRRQPRGIKSRPVFDCTHRREENFSVGAERLRGPRRQNARAASWSLGLCGSQASAGRPAAVADSSSGLLFYLARVLSFPLTHASAKTPTWHRRVYAQVFVCRTLSRVERGIPCDRYDRLRVGCVICLRTTALGRMPRTIKKIDQVLDQLPTLDCVRPYVGPRRFANAARIL